MSDTVIKVENLSKQYRIGSAVDRHRNFREALTDTFTYPFRRLKHAFSRGNATSDKNPEYIWALKDVSFEVKQGEVVGIIGRNGAGKSTLLKILARITEPTEGRATLRGRVGSLLEVGTGFHSELTGEENIYLSGTILGMRSDEISRKFDEIVAFAEMEKFINTPVKYYSSGMYMRLAFAVAAHLEPEILLVDEVLAVGDAEFQKKCLGKMGDVAKEGRTVFFVSHNMGAIARLCERSFWLDKGKIVLDGTTNEVVSRYQSQYLKVRAEWTRNESVNPEEEFAFLSIVIRNSEKQSDGFFDTNEPISMEIKYVVLRRLSGCQIGVRLYNSEGVVIFTTTDADCHEFSASLKEPGYYAAKFTIPKNFLVPSTYYILVAAHLPDRHIYDVVDQAVIFEVLPSVSPIYSDGRLGVVSPLISWDTYQDKTL